MVDTSNNYVVAITGFNTQKVNPEKLKRFIMNKLNLEFSFEVRSFIFISFTQSAEHENNSPMFVNFFLLFGGGEEGNSNLCEVKTNVLAHMTLQRDFQK